MPGTAELIGIVLVVLVIWFVLKLARVAVRLILFIIAVLLVIGAFYYIVAR